MTAHCATCTCADDDLPQPSRSNDRHRKAVIAGALQVLETKRRDRADARHEIDQRRRQRGEGETA